MSTVQCQYHNLVQQELKVRFHGTLPLTDTQFAAEDNHKVFSEATMQADYDQKKGVL